MLAALWLRLHKLRTTSTQLGIQKLKVTPPTSPATDTDVDDSDVDSKEINQKNIGALKQHVKNALKAVEVSGGADKRSHRWMTSGPNKGERAIGPYGFMPSTIKDLISKNSQLKTKYGKVLNIPFGEFKQDDFEDFVNKNPEIHDDLADHYIDRILQATPARTVADISQAWLYGISGFNKQYKKRSAENPYGIPSGDKVTRTKKSKSNSGI